MQCCCTQIIDDELIHFRILWIFERICLEHIFQILQPGEFLLGETSSDDLDRVGDTTYSRTSVNRFGGWYYKFILTWTLISDFMLLDVDHLLIFSFIVSLHIIIDRTRLLSGQHF